MPLIDPKFVHSQSVASLDPLGRLLFVGMLCGADKQGRLPGQPAYLRSTCLPYDDVTLSQVDGWLDDMQALDMILRYDVDGAQYVQIVHWHDYQRMQYAPPSKYPAPDGWLDRIRYTVTKGRIVTYNWQTVDGAPVADTCDASGRPLVATGNARRVATTTVQVGDRTVVVPMDDVDHRNGSAERNQPPQSLTKPVGDKVAFADPRKFGPTGKIAAGKGDNATEVLFEYGAYSEVPLSKFTMAKINEDVTDLDQWRKVIEAWLLRSYKLGNVQGLMQWYVEGIPDGGRKRNGSGRRQAEADSAATANLDAAEARKLFG